jgi:D-alanyl-lipoteichoic acid acyltransferase DltB (MBOAT superfamily)
VYRRQIPPATNFVEFALFVAYFPHLVAGPILRASLLLPQIARPRTITREQIVEGLWLIGWGYFQKMFIADNLADLVGAVFNQSATPNGLDVLVAIYAFAFQIYGDFAGYSNIARGLSKLMGIELNVNFLFPYFVISPAAFWRSWHISLSTWLRDYLYIPLGGNRGGEARTTRNLLITMILGGLWHGAAWTFVAWGSIHGVGLVTERWLDDRRITRLAGAEPPPLPWWHPWVGRLITFNLVCLAWVFFRADSFHLAFEVLGRLFHPGLAGAFNPMLVLVIAGSIASQYVPANVTGSLQAMFSRMRVWQQSFALSGWLLLTNVLGPVGIAPFIYFQF